MEGRIQLRPSTTVPQQQTVRLLWLCIRTVLWFTVARMYLRRLLQYMLPCGM